MPLDFAEQPRRRQRLRKLRRIGDRRHALQRVEAALVVRLIVDEDEVAPRVLFKVDEHQRRIRDLAMLGHLCSVVPTRPDFPRRVVAVEVRPVQFREGAAVIDDPARQRPRLRVMMLERRLDERRRSLGTVVIEDMAPFHDAPAVVVPLADKVDLFPQILPVVAHPDMPGLLIDRHPPRIPQAICPRLRHDPVFPNKRVVGGNGVVLRRFVAGRRRRLVDIDPEHLREEHGHVLPDQRQVGIARAVT